MWLKLLLLTSYLFFVFLLARLLETASWYHETKTFLTSIIVMDPLTMSVRKLKEVLDNRGISYTGVTEKKELVELIESSGQVTQEEVTDAEIPAKLILETTQFTLGSHFYEEVEDTKDSAWLVQVLPENGDPALLPDKIWKDVQQRSAQFGVRFGIFKCSMDSRLCKRKGWTSARLILALPRGLKAKEDVVLHSYHLPSTSDVIFQWVRKKLTSRIREITSDSELEQWLTYSTRERKSGIRVILFSFLKTCPMFLSALAIKFNGRVKFATVDVTTLNSYKKYIKTSEPPIYLVVTSENTYVYGSRRAECLNFKSMELFLKTFVPEVNDVFLWSLLVVNALASFELFFMYTHIWKHFFMFVACVVKYNCILFLLWLMILGLFQFPFMDTCTDMALQFLRFVSASNFATILRSDFKSFYSYTFLLSTFTLFATVSGYMLRKFKWLHTEETVFSYDWWFPPGDAGRYFSLRPPRPAAMPDLEMEAGMELLIERLAVPHLWLQPVITPDYIKDLPVWKYHGWGETDDDLEQVKETVHLSDDEASRPLLTALISNARGSLVNQEVSAASSGTISSKSNCDPSCDSHITKVPAFKEARAPSGMLETRQCSICLETYCHSEVLCGLPCGHNFHANCIMSWISRDNHCCPICRWPTFKSKGHSVHLHSS